MDANLLVSSKGATSVADGFVNIESEVMSALRAHGALDLAELVVVTGLPGVHVRRALAELIEEGKLEELDTGGPARVYRLPRTLRIERLANSG